MHFVSPAGCAMHQAWSDAVGECIETVGGVASGSEEVLEGLPTRLGASRNYVSEPISAFNCTQHTGPGIWETLLIVPDLVSLLTLPTMRILEELPRLSAYHNYVSEPIPAYNCISGSGTLLVVLDLVECIDSSP